MLEQSAEPGTDKHDTDTDPTAAMCQNTNANTSTQSPSLQPATSPSALLYLLLFQFSRFFSAFPVYFLPLDAIHKRGPCCRPVSVLLSVCPSRSCIVCRRLKISLNFFLGLAAASFQFFYSNSRYPLPRGTLSVGRKIH